ncbi:MAG: hypothetical protein LBL56_04810 [Treponema sp.]|nr:hypothetical protein [Treponema sp.]
MHRALGVRNLFSGFEDWALEKYRSLYIRYFFHGDGRLKMLPIPAGSFSSEGSTSCSRGISG